MVKVMCRGGPCYWMREPYTEREKRFLDECEKWDARSGAKAPTLPKGYHWNNFLVNDDEVWPLTPAEEAARYPKNVDHITFYGGAPHRPTSPPTAVQKRDPSRR